MSGLLIDMLEHIWDDVLLLVWFGSAFENRVFKRKIYRVNAYLVGGILAGILFYVTARRKSVYLSLLCRIVGSLCYLAMCKKEYWKKLIYESVIFALAFYGHTIVFVTPILADVRRGDILLIAGNMKLNRACVIGLMFTIAAFFVYAVRNLIDYRAIEGRWKTRFAMVIAFSGLEISVKESRGRP